LNIYFANFVQTTDLIVTNHFMRTKIMPN